MTLRRRLARGIAPVVALVLVVSACGGDEPSGSVETASPSPAPAATPAPAQTDGGVATPGAPDVSAPSAPDTGSDGAVDTATGTPVGSVPEALQFDATLLGGSPFDPETLAGRPVAMWFWAPG